MSTVANNATDTAEVTRAIVAAERDWRKYPVIQANVSRERYIAASALAAVEPLIRQRIAAEIGSQPFELDDFEFARSADRMVGYAKGREDAARIARGESA